MERMAEVIKFVEKETSYKLGMANNPEFVPQWIPFDIPPLDTILGGGFPLGRTSLIIGDFSAGKTFIAQKAIVSAQNQNRLTAFIDVEKCFDPGWFKLTGVDIDNLILSQPGTGEEALDIVIALIKAKVDLVIMDSIAALLPISEEEEGMEHQFIAIQARLFNKGLRKITQANRMNTAFVAINQLREGIGGRFVDERLPAGRGQEFFSSIILRVRRGPFIKEKVGKIEKKIGFNMRLETVKNKLVAPYQSCELPFLFEGGVLDVIAGLVQLGLDCGVIQQRQAYYEVDGNKVLGKQRLIDLLKDNLDLQEIIKNKIQEVK